MPRLTLALLLLVPLTAFGDSFRFEPPLPTSESMVVLRIQMALASGLLPQSVEVSRSGKTIDVVAKVDDTPVYPAVVTPWDTRVPIGVLEAGVYSVTVRVDSQHYPRTLATRTLVVTEARPAFRVEPWFVSTGGGQIRLNGSLTCVVEDIESVTVDGQNVPYTLELCSIIASLPSHAPGAVDVAVKIRGTTHTVRAAVRYIDPGATPDEAVFERILLPVNASGPGAYNSQWLTLAELHNLSDQPLQFFPTVMQNYICDINCHVVDRGQERSLEVFASPKGTILFIPRDQADDVKFGLLVRDSSRESTAWGTEVPVVRERDATSKRMLLANVPIHPLYRTTLRLFSVDGGPASFFIAIAEHPSLARVVVLEPACDTPPCNSIAPGFAQVDLGTLFPTLVGKGEVTLHVQPFDLGGRPHWALVSVTNNTTQHVTTISPQ